jgi:hypothetical protein
MVACCCYGRWWCRQRFIRKLDEAYGPAEPGHEAEAATGADENGDFFDPAYLEVPWYLCVAEAVLYSCLYPPPPYVAMFMNSPCK